MAHNGTHSVKLLHVSGNIALTLVIALACPVIAVGEAPAPSAHWGAVIFPDQERTLTAGMVLNRFSEFNAVGRPFSDLRETVGLNFGSLSWTEHFGPWGVNLTVGAGPTANQPTDFLQNTVTHEILGFASIPVRETRDAFDVSVSGSVNRWGTLLGQTRRLFLGGGFASGSLYHEIYGQFGVRRLSVADLVHSVSSSAPAFLESVSNVMRLSVVGRYTRPYGGVAFPSVAGQTYIGQASLSMGDYRQTDQPDWELEFSASYDSGLFVRVHETSLEKRFMSLAVRFPFGEFETWNEQFETNDDGPTFGGSLTFDLLRLMD